MIKIKSNYVIITICFIIIFTLVTRAQTSSIRQIKNNVSGLTKGVHYAIAKGYQASVLMWQIDAESGARMSAQFSGVVVSKDGVILSAAHVVMPDKTYKVMFPDGRECVAKGLGRITIPPTFMLPDAAMLKITRKGAWPFAEMGWSSILKVNTPCISIAYPESQEQRKPMVRFGRITLLKNEYGFLQSSCVMEPGDSGGPLFDLNGRVIGIHSGIQIPEVINYEVPIDTYRKFWQALSRPVNYTSLPSDSGIVTVDPSIKESSTIFNSKDVIEYLKSKLGCVKISSVIDGQEQQILATLLSTKGMVVKPAYYNKSILVSKSSQVGERPVITTPGGKAINARVIARSQTNDLVLLLADHVVEGGIKFDKLKTDAIDFTNLGMFLISPRPDSAAKIGVFGSLLLNLPKITSYGYIGAATDVKNDQLIITFIQPNSAAQISGLQTGDVIQAVDGKRVEDALDFLKALEKFNAGDTTSIKIFRNNSEYTKRVVLKYPPQKPATHPADLFAGGKSLHRDGFNKVFVHDSAIKAAECRGPVYDTNGRLLGINIARLSRTSTVAIPAATIKKIVLSNL
ncbi:S1C family serine protease [Mucilaginibacter terrae]|uniref:Serine protease Do n=1 Tax=Mucilaginibacter terrae TaxID=1955052 RepID=A0ABU3GZX3_9SPHI|nr:trypsin-like peptidase domain-containing protein [Mucilaginibacter terrae]MDT3405312.1 serine protease Do [Mucilaginibacter terrae]